jgi:hypothetical protein
VHWPVLFFYPEAAMQHDAVDDVCEEDAFGWVELQTGVGGWRCCVIECGLGCTVAGITTTIGRHCLRSASQPCRPTLSSRTVHPLL